MLEYLNDFIFKISEEASKKGGNKAKYKDIYLNIIKFNF